MSLIVTIEETRDATAQQAQWAAGVESARSSLWGHAAVRNLGATFLPQLSDGNTYVSVDEIDAFEVECLHLLRHAHAIAVETGYAQGGVVVPTAGGDLFVGRVDDSLKEASVPPGSTSHGERLLRWYLRNMLEACAVARACGGAILVS